MIERIIVAGGGTGGHLFPGLAVVEEFRRRIPNLSVLFVGTERGIEARVLPKMKERIRFLKVAPLKGRRPTELAKSVSILPSALFKAGRLVLNERADLVIGVGGFASGPVLAAAASLRIPTAILEQNTHVGLTNRVLAPVVDRAYLTYAETKETFGGRKSRVVGNPVRRAFVDASRRAASDPDGFESRADTVLVMGGSQGARALNQTVPEALAKLKLSELGLRVVHQTGSAMRDEVAARYEELGIEAEVVSFIDDMAQAYSRAALVVARAGATTLAELCAIGRPSVLIPYPYAADDHQAKNAEALAEEGAAIAVREEALSVSRLAEELTTLLSSPTRRREMASAARRAGRPDAAAAIVDDLCEWLGAPPAPRVDDAPPATSDEPVGNGGSATRAHANLRGSGHYVPRLVLTPRRARPSRRAPRPLIYS